MYERKIGIAGKGTVGRAFLRQFADVRRRLQATGVDAVPVLVAGRDVMHTDRRGIPEAQLRMIAEDGNIRGIATTVHDGTWVSFTRQCTALGVDMIVDLTAEDTVDAHIDWLAGGLTVVTANKKPLTSRLAAYGRLRDAAGPMLSERYGFETTCGAGLPVLGTLSALHATGDRAIAVTAMVSGTLGYLFSACDDGMPFADAIREAHAKGFTEPDPRDDLSGMDCARKGLIIARLLGRTLSLDDVAVEPLVPERLVKGDAAGFLSALAHEDYADIDRRIVAARKNGAVLRYIVRVSDKGVACGIASVPQDASFARLKGPENLFVISSERYADVPLSIAGPGAGAEVTAAGVVADLTRLMTRSSAVIHYDRHHYAEA